MPGVPPILKQIEGKYEILRRVGEGGMGSLYKVRHRLLDEVRVIKVIQPQQAEDEQLQKRFHQEARTAIRLRHPNIAQLYDYSVDERGTAYIVMEFIDGVTLQQLLQRHGPPSVPLALEVACQGLGALGYLHHQSFVHRDISPDNVMLTRDHRGAPLVKLIDLGIVKRLGGESDLTATGMFLGKVRYSSPEHFGGAAVEIGCPSDVYSFGVLLYELLTGHSPVAGESFSELIGGHLFQPPLDFAQSDPDAKLPPELREALLKALSKRPEDRYGDGDEFARGLEPLRRATGAPGDSKVGDEVRSALETARRDDAAESENTEVGSTQGHLDEQFALATTPSHQVPSAELARQARPPRDSDQAPSVERRELEGHLNNARLLLRLGQRRRAEQEARKAAALDPDCGAVKEFLDSLARDEPQGDAARPNTSPDATAEEEEAAHRLLTQVLDELETQGTKTPSKPSPRKDVTAETGLNEIDTGGIDTGGIDTGRPSPPPSPSPLVERARELFTQERPDEAARRLRQALGEGSLTETEAAAARWLLKEVENELEIRQAREERERGVAEVARQIDGCIAAAELSLAAGHLRQAVKRYGEHPLLLKIGNNLQKERSHAWDRSVVEAVTAIERSIAAGELERAGQQLDFAVRNYGESPEFRQERARLEKAREEAIAHALTTAVRGVEGALAAGKPDAANEQLALARTRFGHREELERLQARLEEAFLEGHETGVHEAITAIRASLAAGRLDLASRQLDFAEERFGDENLREARAELEAARRSDSERFGIS